MKFIINRKALLKPLQLIAGVIERKQTMPILSNALLKAFDGKLLLCGTDLEIELIVKDIVIDLIHEGEVTVPARKLVDICKTLPEDIDINFEIINNQLNIRANRSNFKISILPAKNFPSIKEEIVDNNFIISQNTLRVMIEKTSFSMGSQDVRSYMNGIFFNIEKNQLSIVATDGHRLAVCYCHDLVEYKKNLGVIIPRKAVMEMARLFGNEERQIKIILNNTYIRVEVGECIFTSKLVDSKFPNYKHVIPKNMSKTLSGSVDELKQSLQRVSILSNEKHKSVRFDLDREESKIIANNREKDKAEEGLFLNYIGASVSVGFNAEYLINVLSVLDDNDVEVLFSDENNTALINSSSKICDVTYIVMPMML